MKREEFIKFLQRISKQQQYHERVAKGLDHPDVLAVIERHEAALAEQKAARLKQKTGKRHFPSTKVARKELR